MLTQEEQDLIAQAVAAGKVRVIPRGQSGTNRRRRGPKINRVAVSMVETLARQCMTDREIADHIGKTKKAVQHIRYRYGIRAGIRRMM